MSSLDKTLSQEGRNMAGSDINTRAKLRGLAVLKNCTSAPNFDTLAESPGDAFIIWLNEAIEASVKEPHAMTLSTVDEQGWPDARILILKDVDDRGWHFSTKSETPKGVQIAKNGRVALTFYWPEMARQIRLRGRATRLSDAECERDFAERPLASRVGAFASKQSQVMVDREELSSALKEAQARFEDNSKKTCPSWSVYAVQPDSVEFWQGSADRLHHRLQYLRNDLNETWEKQVLWP